MVKVGVKGKKDGKQKKMQIKFRRTSISNPSSFRRQCYSLIKPCLKVSLHLGIPMKNTPKTSGHLKRLPKTIL